MNKQHIPCRTQPWFHSLLWLLFLGWIIQSPGILSAEKMTILYTNDSHSHLVPFDLPEFGKDIGGIVRRDSFVKKVRADNPATILVDAGDIFQGTAFYSFFKGEVDMLAYDMCGYEVVTIGNHDLDDGLENLQKQLGLTGFPMVCANVVYADSRKPVFAPYVILNKKGIKVAVLGIIGSEAWSVISLKNRNQLDLLDPLETAQKVVSSICEKVDIVILLSHSGIEGGGHARHDQRRRHRHHCRHHHRLHPGGWLPGRGEVHLYPQRRYGYRNRNGDRLH